MTLRPVLYISVAINALAVAGAPAWAQSATDQSSTATAPAAPVAVDAAAETPARSGAAASSIADIVVTGSRVARQGFDAPTPTKVLGAEVLQQRGTTNIGDFLNEIPSFRPSQSAQTNPQNSAAAGQVYADLRGLGSIRTLVLVDGRRHVPSTATGQVDLNLIPTLLIDRIEVVTGGASAQYGSDAVSGVVNALLNKNLQGFRGDISSGISNYGDNREFRASLAFGTDFDEDRGHIIVGGDYVKSNGVDSYLERDWGRDSAEAVTFPNNRPAGTPSRFFAHGVGFTSSPPGGIIIGNNADTNPANGVDVLRGIAFGPGGVPYRFDYGNDPGSGSAYDNTSPNSSFARLGHQLILPVSRRVAMAHLDYDVTDNISVFAEGSYARSGSTFNGPIPRDTATSSIVIQRDNAFLPASVLATMAANNITSFSMGRANQDYTQSFPTNTNTTERFVMGINGNLGGAGEWNWDAYYQQGRNVFDSIIRNTRIEANFRNAVDSIRDPASGQIVCRNVAARAAGCVPLNLFGDGSPSQAAANYVNGDQQQKIITKQRVAAVNLRGNLFETWAGPVAVAIGGEYRKDSATGISDEIAIARGYNFGNAQPFAGSFNTTEGYVEALVPLAKDLPFAQSFDLNGAFRYTDYSSSGTVSTWKVGATWEPFDGIKLRGARSRDIRAPNSAELFSVTTTNSTLRNPFSGVSRSYSLQTLASATLQPERADTTTVGVVLSPRFIPGLTISADFYDIKIDGAIASYGAQFILDSCFSEAQAGRPSFFCDFVSLSGTGTATEINQVSVQLLNIASLKTRGVDFDASYRTNLGSGNLTARFFGTYTADLISDDGLGNAPSYNAAGVIQSRGSVIDRAGQVGGFFSGTNNGATSVPHWQLNGSLTFANDLFSTTVQGRYVGGGKVDKTLVDPFDPDYNAASPISVGPQDVSGRFYLNLMGSVNIISEGQRKLQLYGVVNNLTNVDPPFPATQISGLFDRLGRYYRIGLRFSY